MPPVDPEKLLRLGSTLLHRQVNPHFVRDGRPSGQAFRPIRGDELKQLSVNNGDMVDPAEAYRRCLARNVKSYGVWSLAVDECSEETLKAYADEIEGDLSHAVVDMLACDSKSKLERMADRLADHARRRGCQYRPDAGSDELP